MNDTIPFPPAVSPTSTRQHATGGSRRGESIPPGGAEARWQLIRDYLPQDLSGHSALEIGCDAGLLSLELAARGAEVTAVDADADVLGRAQQAVTTRGLDSRITLYQGFPYDLARLDQMFDIVLFPQLFRRVRYPMLALDIVARRVRRVFICDSICVPGHELEFAPEDLPFDERACMSRPGWPRLAFIENAFAGESSSWWVPNRAATEAMLRAAGLGIAARPADDVYLCQPRAVGEGSEPGAREAESATGTGAAGLTRYGATTLDAEETDGCATPAPAAVPAA